MKHACLFEILQRRFFLQKLACVQEGRDMRPSSPARSGRDVTILCISLCLALHHATSANAEVWYILHVPSCRQTPAIPITYHCTFDSAIGYIPVHICVLTCTPYALHADMIGKSSYLQVGKQKCFQYMRLHL